MRPALKSTQAPLRFLKQSMPSACVQRNASGRREQRPAVRELRLRVAEEQVQGERAAEGVAGRLGVQQCAHTLRGEAIEVGRACGLERREAVELHGRPVAEAVEEDDEQA